MTLRSEGHSPLEFTIVRSSVHDLRLTSAVIIPNKRPSVKKTQAGKSKYTTSTSDLIQQTVTPTVTASIEDAPFRRM